MYTFKTINGYICFQNKEDLESTLAEKRIRAATLKETLQPFVVLVGNLSNPQALLKINDNTYNIESSVKAVDLLFKVFIVLNARYPCEGQQCWTFLQKKIYSIDTKYDTNFIAVNTVYSDLLSGQRKLSN